MPVGTLIQIKRAGPERHRQRHMNARFGSQTGVGSLTVRRSSATAPQADTKPC
jgi:hypothetical protein